MTPLNTILCLFNRGLSIDLNTVEILKAKADHEKKKMTGGGGVPYSSTDESHVHRRRLDQSMSESYLELANVFKSRGDSAIWYRECLLTAFSLAPTHTLFGKIEECANVVAAAAADASSRHVDDAPEKTADSSNGSENSTGAETLNSSDSLLCAFWPPKSVAIENFESVCDQLELSLGKGFSRGCSKLSRKRMRDDSNRNSGDEDACAVRNLDGLLSIEGNVLTESKNYDPLNPPTKAFQDGLDVSMQLISDLLIVINAPRWHLLSWVLSWKILKERCLHLLQNPNCRFSSQELKYLVIDYTQFDEWSSDEEYEVMTGIEPGYESWEDYSDVEEDDK